MVTILYLLVVLASPESSRPDDFESERSRYVFSDVVTLKKDENNDTIDFGFVPKKGVIGDFVWNDFDRDGIQSEREKGIFGVKIWLRDSNATESAPIMSTISNETGYYIFEELSYGTYNVSAEYNVSTESGFPLEFPNSIFEWGPSPVGMGDKEIDSNNHNGTIVILDKDNQINLTIDFGYIPYS